MDKKRFLRRFFEKLLQLSLEEELGDEMGKKNQSNRLLSGLLPGLVLIGVYFGANTLGYSKGKRIGKVEGRVELLIQQIKGGEKCKTHPECSHNTNERNMEKPCSVEFKPHINEKEMVDAIERYQRAKEDGTLDEKFPLLFKEGDTTRSPRQG